jgi:syntaxin 1B/2/3
VNPDISEAEISQALIDPNSQIFQQALLSSTRSSQARSTLSEVQSRHNEIISIERKIIELSQMFTELNVMISLQDEQIDPIVTQADNTREVIAEGLKQVSRATRLARAVRRKKWWCIFIILLIIIIIVVVVVVTQVVNKKTSPS